MVDIVPIALPRPSIGHLCQSISSSRLLRSLSSCSVFASVVSPRNLHQNFTSICTGRRCRSLRLGGCFFSTPFHVSPAPKLDICWAPSSRLIIVRPAAEAPVVAVVYVDPYGSAPHYAKVVPRHLVLYHHTQDVDDVDSSPTRLAAAIAVLDFIRAKRSNIA